MPRGKRKLPPSASSTKQRTLDNLGVLQPIAHGSLFPSSPAHHEDTDDELCGPEGELPKKILTPPVAGIPAAFFSPAGASGLVSRQLSAESGDSLRRSTRATRWMGGSGSTTPASSQSVRSVVIDPNDQDYVEPTAEGSDIDSGKWL